MRSVCLAVCLLSCCRSLYFAASSVPTLPPSSTPTPTPTPTLLGMAIMMLTLTRLKNTIPYVICSKCCFLRSQYIHHLRDDVSRQG